MFLAAGRSLGVACALAPAAVAPATSPAPPLRLGLARVGSACARHGSAARLGLSRFALFGMLHRRPLLSPGPLAAPPVTAETLVLAILAATAEAIAIATVATFGTLR